MSSSTKLYLLILLASQALSNPQRGYPAAISAEFLSIIPAQVSEASQLIPYLSAHPAAASTYLAEFDSIVAANPTYFPSLASELGLGASAQGGGGQPSASVSFNDIGVPASISDELMSIRPTAQPATEGESAFFATRPALATSFDLALSSIVAENPTYFPTLASEFGVGAGGGAQQTPSFMSSAMQMSSVMQMSSAPAIPSPHSASVEASAPIFGTQTRGAGGGQQSAAASSPSAAGNAGQAMQTPGVGLGLSGVLVAGVAGLAVLL